MQPTKETIPDCLWEFLPIDEGKPHYKLNDRGGNGGKTGLTLLISEGLFTLENIDVNK